MKKEEQIKEIKKILNVLTFSEFQRYDFEEYGQAFDLDINTYSNLIPSRYQTKDIDFMGIDTLFHNSFQLTIIDNDGEDDYIEHDFEELNISDLNKIYDYLLEAKKNDYFWIEYPNERF